MSELEQSMGPLLAGFLVSPEGKTERISWPLSGTGVPETGYSWIHLLHGAEEGVAWLRDKSGVPGYAVEALLESETHPRCAKFDEGMLVILRGVNLNPGADPEDMVSIRMWVEKNRIVSVRMRRLLAIADMRNAMESNRAPVSVGTFLVALCESLSIRIETVVMKLSDDLDELEQQSLEDGTNLARSAISALRHDLIVIRRYVAPQREALSRLAASDDNILSTKDRIHVRETLDTAVRIVDELDASRERATVISEQLMDKRAEVMNRNMMVLSIVAAVFLPLGFLTGLLGINVGGMPGAQNPYAFWIVCALITFLGAGAVAFFKVKRWI
ncbi:MAG: zinc transporter ZntB [Parvibaculum sp.]